MDIFNFSDFNYWAVLAAVVFSQLLGAVWYGVFSRPWLAEIGLSKKDMEAMKGTPRQWYPYLLSTCGSALSTVVLALLVSGLGINSVVGGLSLGLIVAIGFILTTNGTNYAFEGRSLKLFLINSGYPLVTHAVAGILLAAWV